MVIWVCCNIRNIIGFVEVYLIYCVYECEIFVVVVFNVLFFNGYNVLI